MYFRHFLYALFLCLLSTGPVHAIILSLDVDANISIPNSLDGVYLDFTDVNDASSYTLTTSAPAQWDINLFYGGAAFASSPTFSPVLASATTNAAVLNLSLGTEVGSSSDFPSSYSGSTDHMGVGAQQFQTSSIGYVGFVLNPGAENYYGWMSVTLNDDGTSGTIHNWAWETSGASITVGAVPEPSHAGLLCGLFAASFMLMRRSHFRQRSWR